MGESGALNVINSLLSENSALGRGANDGEGGNGGAIFETPDLPGFYVIAKAPAVIDNSQILR